MTMKKQILIGTTNQAKIMFMRTALAPLVLETLTLQALKIQLTVEEDGQSTAQNAAKKARAYFAVTNIPTLTNDGGLHIGKFSKSEQPGAFVRRVQDTTRPMADEEMVRYYQSALQKVGGESLATWEGSLALAISQERIVSHTFSFQTIMSATRRGKIFPGSPLDLLTIEPISGKYYSEMTWTERKKGAEFKQVFEFVRRYFSEL